MIKTPFKTLLTQFRERLSLTKVDLARMLKVTDGYIRKLEMGYTPPTFTICNELAIALKLKSDEKQPFFEAAFLGRLGEDISFYTVISQDTSSTHTPSPILPVDSKTPFCYVIAYTLKPVFSSIQALAIMLPEVIAQCVQDSEATLLGLDFQSGHWVLQVGLSSHMNPQSWTQDLKATISRRIKSKLPTMVKQMTIWEPETSLFTLTPPQASPPISQTKESDQIVYTNKSSFPANQTEKTPSTHFE